MVDMERNNVCIRFIGKDTIDFEQLKSMLPFDFIIRKKGDILLKRYVVENDVAILEFELQSDTLEDKISEFLNKLKPYKSEMVSLSNVCDTIFRIYLESDMAQMYGFIPNELLAEIAELKLDFEISIFSEGMCEDR